MVCLDEDRRLDYLSDQQKEWLLKASQFTSLIPLKDSIEADTTNIFRRDIFEKACKEGFGALPFSTEYGGSGGDYLSFCLVNEEFARKCLPIMSALGVHVLCQEPIYRFGTEEQKKKYLPKSACGEYLAAFALTEAGAGSDTAALTTAARLVGDEYILNGSKIFITNGASADYYVVMAKLQDSCQDSLTSQKNITAFIVEKNFPGCKTGQKFDMLGMRGYSTCELVFEECSVPKEQLLGQPGWGQKVALSSLAKGRVTIAAQATGWAQGAMDVVLQYKHKLSDKDSDASGIFAWQIRQMSLLIESARVLTYQAACTIDNGQSDITLAAMAKIQATDAAMKISSDAMNLLGLKATQPEYLLERIFRDAKAGQIYEGTNQIQKMLIARELLK